jgi:hypothetical protein
LALRIPKALAQEAELCYDLAVDRIGDFVPHPQPSQRLSL